MGFFEWMDRKDEEAVRENDRQNEIERQKDEWRKERFREYLREQGFNEQEIKDREQLTFKNGTVNGGSATGGVTQVALFRTFGTSNLDQVFNECAPQMMQGIRETQLQTQALHEELAQNNKYHELLGRYNELQKNYEELLQQNQELLQIVKNLGKQ